MPNGSSLEFTPIFGRYILPSFHHAEYVIFQFGKSTLLWIILNLGEDELLFQNTLIGRVIASASMKLCKQHSPTNS